MPSRGTMKPFDTLLRIGSKVLKSNEEGEFFQRDDLPTFEGNRSQNNSPKLNRKSPPRVQKIPSGKIKPANSTLSNTSNEPIREQPREFLVDKTVDSESSLLPGNQITKTKLKQSDINKKFDKTFIDRKFYFDRTATNFTIFYILLRSC